MGHICIDMPNTNNKWVQFGLSNVDMFIIHIGFGLANVDTIRTLTGHEHDPSTRITTHNWTPITSKNVKIPTISEFDEICLGN